MSPRIEGESLQETDTLALYFTIDLASDGAFDGGEFDRLAKEITYDSASFKSFLKFIVHQETMYVFKDARTHSGIFDELRLGEESLRCAGYIRLDFVPLLRGKDQPSRVIYDNSSTLEHVLSIEDSESYKLGELKRTLGEYFSIR